MIKEEELVTVCLVISYDEEGRWMGWGHNSQKRSICSSTRLQ